MKKARVIIAKFSHETNCFCSYKAGLKEFEEFELKDRDEVILCHKGKGTRMGGIIAGLESEGIEIVPIMSTEAMPSGLVTKEMFEFAKNRIVQAIKDTENADGILLELHGAMVSEATLDGDGTLLKAVRNTAGSEMPIVAVLDLHACVSDMMVENANVLIIDELYPHIDGFERGYEAGKCMARIIRKEISPVMKLRHVPILATLIETAKEPHAELLKKAHKWEEKPKVVNVVVAHGFPWTDVPESTISVVAVTDGDNKLAEDIVDDMAKTIWERRNKFKKTLLSTKEAVKEAMEFPSGPVIITDTADNPGGGGTCNSTFILRELIKAGARNVAFALISDPEAVQQAINAGVGSKLKLCLGGKLGSNELTGGPVEIIATVKIIADGQFFNTGPMRKGELNNIGRTVVLDADGIEIIVSERRFQPFDPEIFHRVGIEPTEKKIIVLKAVLHFRASFEPIAKKILDVDNPGYVTMNFKSLNFKNISRPVYPLDTNFEYIV